jgi:hypothetical protein
VKEYLMNYEHLDDTGATMAVYFLLDQSRNEPPAERARLMLNMTARLDQETDAEARAELRALAEELFDCDQQAQRLIGTVREDNAALLRDTPALSYIFDRLERCDLETKLELTGSVLNFGLVHRDMVAWHDAWMETNARCGAFAQRLELFLFRLRTNHWGISNADARAAAAGSAAAGSAAAALAARDSAPSTPPKDRKRARGVAA